MKGLDSHHTCKRPSLWVTQVSTKGGSSSIHTARSLCCQTGQTLMRESSLDYQPRLWSHLLFPCLQSLLVLHPVLHPILHLKMLFLGMLVMMMMRLGEVIIRWEKKREM